MKSSVIIVVALENEIRSEILPSHVPVIYSGIGKINATLATMEAVLKFSPDLIINFGTVGKINKNLHGLIPISKVVQRDMCAQPLAPRGQVPFSEKPNEFFSIASGYVCGTGDSFVTSTDDWLHEQGVDVVDMELFAIAAVAHQRKIDWMSYKFISDDANESSGEEWSKQVNHGEELFLEQLLHHLK